MQQHITVGFVRDNPFIKNDARRPARRTPVPTPLPEAPKLSTQNIFNRTFEIGKGVGREQQQHNISIGKEKKMGMGDRNERAPIDKKSIADDRLDTISTASSGSDIEYGPGIVEKLKAKFHRLSGLASKDVKVNPHATGKRCPSVDDILAAPDEDPVHHLSPQEVPSQLSPLHRLHSRSTSDMLDGEEERRAFSVHRTVKLHADEEDHHIQPISTLRQKFEASVQRTPSQNMRHSKTQSSPIRIRPVSVDFSSSRPESADREIYPKRDALPLSIAPSISHQQTPPIAPPTKAIDVSLTERPYVPYYAPSYPSENRTAKLATLEAPPPPQAPPPSDRREIMFGDPTGGSLLKVFEAKKEANHRVVETKNNRVVPELSRYETREHTNEEPEFVKIGRRLRRSSIEIERDDRRREMKEELHQRKRESIIDDGPKTYIPSRRAELPSLSSSARIVRDDVISRTNEVISPPDPDSARQRSAPLPPMSPPVFVRTDITPPLNDASPPPEEPNPPKPYSDENVFVNSIVLEEKDLERDFRGPMSPPPYNTILPTSNDASGVNEMQLLLTRFQKSRVEASMSPESAPYINTYDLPTNLYDSYNQQPSYVTNEVRSYDFPPRQLDSSSLTSEVIRSAHSPTGAILADSLRSALLSPLGSTPSPVGSSHSPSSQSYDVTRATLVYGNNNNNNNSNNKEKDIGYTVANHTRTVDNNSRSHTSQSMKNEVARDSSRSSSYSTSKNTDVSLNNNNNSNNNSMSDPSRPVHFSGSFVHSYIPGRNSYIPPSSSSYVNETSIRSSHSYDVTTRPTTSSEPMASKVTSVSSSLRPNVVSISVRDDPSTYVYTKNNYDDDIDISSAMVVNKRPAPPPPPPPSEAPPIVRASPGPKPTPPPKYTPPSPVISSSPAVSTPPSRPVQSTSSTDSQRKSLSAKYLEEKSKQANREKPYGDEYMELKSEPKESSVDEETTPVLPAPTMDTVESSSVVIEAEQEELRQSFLKDSDIMTSSDSEDDDPPMAARPSSIGFIAEQPLIAGDGNPVRHSLLSLVMEEDIPALMEAMSEKYFFEFIDLNNCAPSTSSIIHPLEVREKRRKDRKVDNIRFEPTAPTVYTYLDEGSARGHEEWIDGTEVDYNTYQKMLSMEQQEYEKGLTDLKAWKQSLVQASRVDLEPAAEDYSMGVTSRFTYTTRNDNNTISV